MKRCPACGQGYTDNTLNFCLNDGELLMQYSGDQPPSFAEETTPTSYADDSPPTLVMNSPRITNQEIWQTPSPPVPWQNPNIQNAPYLGGYALHRDQTLPTIALALGISSIVMVCCYGGIWLGLPAAIVGFLGLRNAQNNPERFHGGGMAIAGLVIGIITFLISMIVLIVGAVAS
jgi:hypothetical protein